MARKRMVVKRVHVAESALDLVGDVHGCFDLLMELTSSLGYVMVEGSWVHPEGRKLVFLGDLMDRGPSNDRVLFHVLRTWEAGLCYWVRGNHDDKAFRWLKGNPVHLCEKTVRDLTMLYPDPECRAELGARLEEEVPHVIHFDDDRLVACHAFPYGGKQVMYGPRDPDNKRVPWWEEYTEGPFVAFGHYWDHVQAENAMCLDGAACRGGSLMALRWPSREVVSVKATDCFDVEGYLRFHA